MYVGLLLSTLTLAKNKSRKFHHCIQRISQACVHDRCAHPRVRAASMAGDIAAQSRLQSFEGRLRRLRCASLTLNTESVLSPVYTNPSSLGTAARPCRHAHSTTNETHAQDIGKGPFAQSSVQGDLARSKYRPGWSQRRWRLEAKHHVQVQQSDPTANSALCRPSAAGPRLYRMGSICENESRGTSQGHQLRYGHRCICLRATSIDMTRMEMCRHTRPVDQVGYGQCRQELVLEITRLRRTFSHARGLGCRRVLGVGSWNQRGAVGLLS